MDVGIPPESRVYASDFECGTEVDYNIDGEVSVYLWHIRDIYDDTCFIGYDIETFFGWFEHMRCNNTMWFHNLSYDGSFIVDHALRIGMTSETYKEKKAREDGKKEARTAWLKSNSKMEWSVSKTGKRTKTYVPKKVTEEFDTPAFSFQLVKSGGKWITLTLINSNGFKLDIHDSGCKYTTCASLEDIAQATGQEGKSTLDVFKRRGPGYKATAEDIARVEGDTRILANAMRLMYDRGLTASTLAGDAWKIWREMYMNKLMARDGLSKDEALKVMDTELFPKLNEKMAFPDGTIVDIRDAYFGGRVYLRPEYRNMDVMKVSSIDSNSMHSSQMYSKPMPYGKPVLSMDRPISAVYIVHLKCRFKVKKGMDPTIQRKQSFRSIQAEWVYESDPDGECLTLTMNDFEAFIRHYDIEGLDMCKKYYVNFKHASGEFFCEYIDRFIREKGEAKVRMKECKARGDMGGYAKAYADYYFAKILMNALYGKWGQNDEKPYQWVEMDDDRIKIKESDISAGEYFSPFGHKYLPIAVMVTSWSRKALIETFEKIPGAIYCDTDSVYYIDKDEDLEELGIDVHPTKLGAWDQEKKDVEEARFIRAKTYILRDSEYVTEDNPEGLVITCGGMPAKIKENYVTWENFKPGAEFPVGKLLPKRVKGGVVLKDVGYRMSE